MTIMHGKSKKFTLTSDTMCVRNSINSTVFIIPKNPTDTTFHVWCILFLMLLLYNLLLSSIDLWDWALSTVHRNVCKVNEESADAQGTTYKTETNLIYIYINTYLWRTAKCWAKSKMTEIDRPAIYPTIRQRQRLPAFPLCDICCGI